MATGFSAIQNQYLSLTPLLPSSAFQHGGLLSAIHRPSEGYGGSDFKFGGTRIEQYVCLVNEEPARNARCASRIQRH